MSNLTLWKQNWTDYFDTSALVDETVIERGKETPILVDVGGSIGVDVIRFLEERSDVQTGSLVLQDTGDVIVMAKVDPRISTMTHDFFKPQPILHSRIYFLHSVLHDWADPQAVQILRGRNCFTLRVSKLLRYGRTHGASSA